MSKKQFFTTILISVILALLVNIFAGRFLTAKISTLPVLNKWNILSPQAPIVINNHETVRVSDGSNAGQIADQVKSKIATVVLVGPLNSVSVAGSAVNLTSDGSFVTAASAFGGKAQGSYFVVLNDGTSAPITGTATDSATSLVFFKAALSNVPVRSLGDSSAVRVGDSIFFARNSLQDFIGKILFSTVSAEQDDIEGQIFQSDYPRRSFAAASGGQLLPGQPLVDTSGNIEGVWNGSAIISADVLKAAMALYFNNPAEIIRPAFGFSYSMVTENDSMLGSLPQGALIKTVNPNSPAKQAGLIAGDIITTLDGQAVSETSPLEPMLEQYKPGDKLDLTVARGKTPLNLTLTAGALK